MRKLRELDHLSYSSVSTYLRCPRSWRYRYLEKVASPVGVALPFGSAFHEAVEQYLTMRHSGDALPPAELFDAAWQTQLERREDIDWRDETPDSMLDLGTRMLTDDGVLAQLDSIKPLVLDDVPVIEKRVSMTVPGVPIPIIGYIDLITDDGVPGDLKTSSRKWYGDKAEKEMQPVFYLATLNQEGYELNPERRFRHYVFTKTKAPAAQVLETTRTVADMMWLFGLIGEVWQAIVAGAFPPNPGSWLCPKYCDYSDICRP